MTPDQLRALSGRLAGLADGLDEIRRAVGDTADDPAADLRTAVAYLRQCADVQPAAWMRPDNRVREESFTGEQFSRSAQPPPIGTWVPLYAHPAPRPRPEVARPRRPYGTSTMSEMGIIPMCDEPQPERQPASVPTSNKWWCPQCKVEVPPEHVTYIETHDSRCGGCGCGVLSTKPVNEPTEAQIEAAAYERAAQQCLLIASGVEHYTQYYEACSDCADAINALIPGEKE